VTGEAPVLVIGADVRSRQLNFEDLRTVFLYGDGAGAAVLRASETSAGIWHSILSADGDGAEAVCIPAGGSREPLTPEGLAGRRNMISMPNGRLVARAAREGFRALAARLETESAISLSGVGFFCLHQPNLFLLRDILADLQIPEERCWVNFPRYANTTSASVAIALSEANAAGVLRAGEWVCLGAVGAGFAGGIQLVRWEEAGSR